MRTPEVRSNLELLRGPSPVPFADLFRSLGEPWPFRMAVMQSQNKMYMAVPNLTDISFAGIQYLGIHIHRLRLEILEEGEGTPRYDDLMMQMINLKLKFGEANFISCGIS